MKNFLVFGCFIFSLNFLQAQNDYKVIAYYSADSAQLHKYDFKGMTHLIYGFGDVVDGVFGPNSDKDLRVLEAMKIIKKENPGLKTAIALGGWIGCEFCSQTFNDEKLTKAFVQSVKNFLNYYDLDGIDLDWEYPAIEGFPGHLYTPADKDNFTRLVRLLDEKLEDKFISFAAGGFQEYLDHSIDWQGIEPYVDFVNLMSYDLVNGYSTKTGHHTPLFSSYEGEQSADNAIQFFKKNNFPLRKVIIGAALYSRAFENVPNKNFGIYQPGKFKAYVPYAEARELFSTEKGFQHYWDEKNAAGFSYNTENQVFVTGDTEKSIKRKVQYVKDQNLGGIMYWELGTDSPKDGLYQLIDLK